MVIQYVSSVPNLCNTLISNCCGMLLHDDLLGYKCYYSIITTYVPHLTSTMPCIDLIYFIHASHNNYVGNLVTRKDHIHRTLQHTWLPQGLIYS